MVNNLNMKCYLSAELACENDFLKDHVTLKTEIMAAENSALPPQE